ncbi:PQQ-binding-like beta-propeller repeat protein [Chloroflexota bacterium]
MRLNLNNKGKTCIRIPLLILVVLSIVFSTACIGGMQPVGWAGVALSDGVIYTGTIEGRLIGIFPDGSRQWAEPLKIQSSGGGFGCVPSLYGGAGCGQGSSAGVAIYGTPIVLNDLVYIAGYNGKVYAYNAKTLGQRWIYPRESYIDPIVAGMANDNDTIYVSDSSGKIIALDAATGDMKWEFQASDKVWSTPIIDGNTLYAGCFDNKLYAIDKTTGIKKWEFATGGAIQSSPLVYQNAVYFGSFDRKLYAVDAETGTEKWSFGCEKWFWAKPLAYGDTILACGLDGFAYLLDAQTGEKKADFNLGSPVASSPVMINENVFIATHGGSIFKLNTTNDNIRVIATVDTQVNAPLSANDKILYVHTSSSLTIHPIDIESGAKLMPISLKSGN